MSELLSGDFAKTLGEPMDVLLKRYNVRSKQDLLDACPVAMGTALVPLQSVIGDLLQKNAAQNGGFRTLYVYHDYPDRVPGGYVKIDEHVLNYIADKIERECLLPNAGRLAQGAD